MKYIIGGGIAGLIAAFYNPDYTVLTMDKGGQMNNSFPLGPRILEATGCSHDFMSDVGLDRPVQVFSNGYLYHGKIYDSMDTAMRRIYSLKTRGIAEASHIVGNSGRNTISGWPITKELITALLNLLSGRVKKAYISYINTSEKVIHVSMEDEWQKLPYEDIISTIPITELFHLVHEEDGDQATNPDKFEYLPTYFVHLPNIEIFQRYDFVYILDEYTKFHRATRVSTGTILESRNPIDLLDFPQYLPAGIKSTKLKQGQIIADANLKEYNDVKLLGRFSQWSHSIRTAEVIKRVREELHG